jgi:hypothetical protein
MPAGFHNTLILDASNSNDSVLTPLAGRQGGHQASRVGHDCMGRGGLKKRRTCPGFFGVDVPD